MSNKPIPTRPITENEKLLREKVYDREAMLKIEAYSPAYHKSETLVET